MNPLIKKISGWAILEYSLFDGARDARCMLPSMYMLHCSHGQVGMVVVDAPALNRHKDI